MNMAYRTLVGLMLLCMSVPTVRAQNTETIPREALEEAREIAYSQINDMADKIAGNFQARTWPLIERDLIGKYDQATLDELLNELIKLQKRYVLAAINDTPPMYARRLTVDELREINAYLKSPQKDDVAFNGSPVGQKMWWASQDIMREMTDLLLRKKDAFQAEISSAVRKVLRSHGHVK
jgi:hypothetical protein